MASETMTMEEIRHAGLDALARELGAVGLICFLQLFEHGTGDYTTERRQWLEHDTVNSIVAEVQTRRTVRA